MLSFLFVIIMLFDIWLILYLVDYRLKQKGMTYGEFVQASKERAQKAWEWESLGGRGRHRKKSDSPCVLCSSGVVERHIHHYYSPKKGRVGLGEGSRAAINFLRSKGKQVRPASR